MQFSESRRQFLRNFFPRTDGNSESTSGLDGIMDGADLRMQDEKTVHRRDALKALGAGLVGVVATSTFSLDDAEAYDRPQSLVGTPASLAKQSRIFTQDNLSMLYEKDLHKDSPFRRNKRLIEINRSTSHYFVDGVEDRYAIARPYVSLFLQILSEQFYKRLKNRLKVTGLTRSVEYQNYLITGRMPGRPLRKSNPNATKPDRSPHVRGAGIDISYLPMDSRQKQWMRNVLIDLEKAGYIEATEEIGQSAFHIMVFKNYSGYVQRKLGMNDRNFARYYERITGGRIY